MFPPNMKNVMTRFRKKKYLQLIPMELIKKSQLADISFKFENKFLKVQNNFAGEMTIQYSLNQ